MDTTIKADWYFPPSKSRSGFSRGPHDVKHIIIEQSNRFSAPIIFTSDLHSWTKNVFHLLDQYVHLDKFIVISAGDMAGQPVFGCDGNPTDYYIYMKDRCKEFYFVQGNHDRPDMKKRHLQLRNDNGIYCDFEHRNNKGIIKTAVGKIGGVHGTISEKWHPYKKPESEYLRKVSNLLKKKIDILITHDTPEIPLNTLHHKYECTTGNKKLFTLTSQHKPKMHIYGHCHHFEYDMTGACDDKRCNVTHLNADARVLIFVPSQQHVIKDILKKDLEDLWIDDPILNDDCWTIESNKMDIGIDDVSDKTRRHREYKVNQMEDFPSL